MRRSIPIRDGDELEAAPESQQASARLLQLSKDYIAQNLPDAQSLYIAVADAVQEAPSLISPELAEVLCGPTMDLFETDLDVYYDWFVFWKAKLPANRRIELLHQASDSFLQKKEENCPSTTTRKSTGSWWDRDTSKTSSPPCGVMKFLESKS